MLASGVLFVMTNLIRIRLTWLAKASMVRWQLQQASPVAKTATDYVKQIFGSMICNVQERRIIWVLVMVFLASVSTIARQSSV
jgi:hypothetical protein